MARPSVWIGVGANLEGSWGTPEATVGRAIAALAALKGADLRASPFYATAPVGSANQPDFINAVCGLNTSLSPAGLLAMLKQLERKAGRGRGRRWAPRSLDLDVLDYKGRTVHWPGSNFSGPRRRLVLPHPEMHRRAFVLRPLADVAPGWKHPVLGTTVEDLLKRLPRDADMMRRLG